MPRHSVSTVRPDPVWAAIALIKQAGFVDDGETRTEQVRIATKRSPVFGGIGGELATFGGRQRFAKPGTQIKVTVGKRTVCFYRVKPPAEQTRISATDGLGMANTSDLTKIQELIAALPTE